MTDLNVLEKAIDAIVVLNAAFTNIRLYPPTSAMIGKSIDNADSILKGIFEQESSITFAESEKNLVISGHGLDGKDNKRPQVLAFVQMMLTLGIKSITLNKGLEKSELIGFLEVVTKKPEDLRKEGGIQKVMSGKNIKNIHLDQKVYVSMDKSRETMDGDNVKTGEATVKDPLQQIKTGLEGLIKGQEGAFSDKLVMQALPAAVFDLISKGKDKTADAITLRLGAGMMKENADIRAEAALAMAKICSRLISEKRMNDMVKLSPRLAEWIKFETMTPAAYKHITNQLRVLSQYLILNRRYKEAVETLAPFYMITSGKINKNESIKSISAKVLEDTATANVMNTLAASLKSGDRTAEDAMELQKILKTPAQIDEVSMVEKQESPSDTATIEFEKQSSVEIEFVKQLKSVDQLVQNRDIKSAVKMLLDLVLDYARKRDFDSAETLRDKMMEIDPMALGDIIKSGEIIEEEKSKAIDQEHLDLWSELYKTMTKEESSTLFFAMRSAKFSAGQAIFHKGDHDQRLYFVNKGRIKLFINQKGNETFIKELKPGDIMGEETFFSLSLSTTSAVASTPVEMTYLDKAVLPKWELKSSGIEPKLHDYILKKKKKEDALEEKGPQLRTHQRIAVTGKIKVQFLDASGTPSGEPILGALSDVSQGGLSFYLNIKKEKISKLFLHPKLNMKFSLKTEEGERQIDHLGTMVAAVPHFYDYSIHVKFDKPLEKKLVEGIQSSSGSEDAELDFLKDS